MNRINGGVWYNKSWNCLIYPSVCNHVTAVWWTLIPKFGVLKGVMQCTRYSGGFPLDLKSGHSNIDRSDDTWWWCYCVFIIYDETDQTPGWGLHRFHFETHTKSKLIRHQKSIDNVWRNFRNIQLLLFGKCYRRTPPEYE